jgi:Glycosyltransferase family 87
VGTFVEAVRPGRLAGLRLAGARVLAPVLLGVLPAVLATIVLVAAARRGILGVDLRYGPWQAARDIVHGRDPYAGATPESLLRGVSFVYPPLAALLALPLAPLSAGAAGALVAVGLIAAAAGTLLVLGVRDWRCYGAMFGSYAVLGAVQTGNLTLVVGLGAALAWRWRDRPWPAAAALAVPLALKLFAWPLLAFFVVTRRTGTAVRALAGAVVLDLAAWAVIGFDGLAGFPHRLSLLERLQAPRGYGVMALAPHLGASPALSRALSLAAGAALLAGAAVVARRADGERRAFVLAVAATLVLSPIVWLHYLALLAVPLAITHRRLHWTWLVPLVWLTFPEHGGHHPLLLVALAVSVTALLVELARPLPQAVAG